MFCILDGLDASGKATQSKRLAEFIDARLISFPTYNTEKSSVVGPVITDHLKGGWMAFKNTDAGGVHSLNLDALVFQCVMSVNKYELAGEIEDVLAAGRSVVCDRYWPSAYAYGGADGLDPAWLRQIHRSLPKPDICFLLDVDYETSLARRPDRRDRYERLGKAFYGKVRSLYRALWLEEASGHTTTRWVVIDGSKSEDDVTTAIMEELAL